LANTRFQTVYNYIGLGLNFEIRGKWNSVKWNETRRIGGAIFACFYVARVWQRQLGFLVTFPLQGNKVGLFYTARQKSNPSREIVYLSNCSRYIYQICRVYRWRFDPHTLQIVLADRTNGRAYATVLRP